MAFYDHHKRAAEVLRDELRPHYDPVALIRGIVNDSHPNAAEHAVPQRAIA
jgi:hypothetical protein